jgi:2-keto-4-pentenoate hydratase/2-oxohepta-3-ene-1,7-dioic acid hydratase in catechol pathway
MRLVSYERNGVWRPGILLEAKVVDVDAAARLAGLDGDVPAGADWSSRAVIQSSPQTREALLTAATELIAGAEAVTEIRLGPPIPDPDKILCMGLNYRDHADEAQLPLPIVPLFFAKFRNSLIGPEDEIVLPPTSEQIDYEAELAVVIGKRCRRVAPEDALAY